MSDRTGTRSGGRPRDPQLDTAILEATLHLLDEAGYTELTLEEVARRAGTSRPAIYRRWAGRAPLVLSAIATRLDVPSPPDTGCTLCDLAESFNIFLAAYRTIRPDALNALYSECVRSPELQERYRRTVVEPSRTAVRRTLEHATARGDLREDADREQLLDFVASLVHYRVLFGRHLSDDDAERAIETLLRGAAVDYGALLEHSEALENGHLDDDGTHHVHIGG
ncbi:TetR family transcriptional regulator [Stackebrandtia albiflava]|uniref:TetR family transcriptional regulator n=1 Tax=Stackebrandtia albiflava TaxID=406432 RepID=A0A562VC70_9ACTN|nr:TetR/AcrR family transcriptional regulator [Stackebrandtia albiflava]TWJ15466.1 TetR family transcriptional regulator [Stackebrandtia albiflava]